MKVAISFNGHKLIATFQIEWTFSTLAPKLKAGKNKTVPKIKAINLQNILV